MDYYNVNMNDPEIGELISFNKLLIKIFLKRQKNLVNIRRSNGF